MKETRRQADALRQQRTLAERLTVWRDERRAAAHKRAKENRHTGPRGVDRVPDRLRVHPEPPAYLVKHTDANYRTRRDRALWSGGLRTGSNEPHVNPDKDRRLAGKARRAARRSR
jgi:hypothetical protein